MPDSRDPRHNAAWRAARQWQARARQTRPGGPLGGLKLLFTWLLFGVMMIVAMVLGLFFLLVGWAMMPFLRHRMKKRMEQMRADQAQDVGGGPQYRETVYRETRYRESRRGPGGVHEQQVLEGDYEVREDARGDRPRD
ncbi:hypothetical protein FIU83_15535 [Halomonas sp. THAF5a]|uniref:hypothetical protein n=1 Tax=Halomonas sp. THAF5a TaxID=2587844 RepID=UPI0012681BBE|nr:hypothetical protein [Halomonas sp. THAF5a]QFU03059.1 hypothetical protein FIU83_15535 [Halomonas sp. THAF5a]